MADNFNLRQFLTENKLTKNAQLLKEQEGFKTFQDSGIEGLYMDTVSGVKIYSATDSSVSDYCAYILEYPDGKIDIVDLDVSGQPISSEELQEYDVLSDKPVIADFISRDIANELGEGEMDETSRSMKNYMDEDLNEGSDYGFDALMDAADDLYPEGTPENGKLVFAIEKALHANKIDTSKFGHDMNAVARAVEAIANQIGLNETTNKMTAKERRLVEMVQRALGEENVDYTMGRQDDSNQFPNPAPELNIPEGDEMPDETVIPEYTHIEELLKHIEESTNRVAEEHKIKEMRKIAEALRAEAKKMEESEHSKHISPTIRKQRMTDATKMDKAAEKAEAVLEKKFNKKETKETKTQLKETKMETTFNLKKFLTENKLTTNSKMLNEYGDSPTYIVDTVEEFLDNAGLDPQGELDAVEELALWCTGKIAQLQNEV